jgi:O-succinylbenzoic acid--CoA ligase
MSRIVAVRLERLVVPFRIPLRTAERTWRERRVGLIVLLDEDGRMGLGELPLDDAGASAAWSAAQRIGHALTGRDPAEAAGTIVAGEPGAGSREQIVTSERAVAGAMASAALDLFARATGRTVAAELARITGIHVPAGGERTSIEVSGLVGGGSIDEAVRAALEAVVAGFGCLKLKGVPNESSAALLERVAAVRAAVGPAVRLRLDANGTWDEPDAIQRLRALASVELEYVEQPISAAMGPEALARVRAASPVPVAADEAVVDLAAARRLLAAAAADVLVVKPSRVGGPLETLRIAQLADAQGVSTVLSTSFETGVGLACAIHAAAVLPGAQRAHGLGTTGLLQGDLLAGGPRPDRGRLVVPVGPGLGITLDPVALARFRTVPIGGVTIGGSDGGAGGRSSVGSRRGSGSADSAGPAPDRPAVVDGSLRWSGTDLDAAAVRIGWGLAKAGVSPGSRVALLAGETAGTIAAIHAVRRTGAVLVSLNRRAAPVELADQLAQTAPVALLHDAATADLARAALRLAPTRPGVATASFDIATLLAADGTDVPTRPSGGQADADHPIADDGPFGGVDPAAPATLVFTSGTTGRPKAAILTGAAHAASAAAWAEFLVPTPTDRWLLCLPLHHVAGLGILDRAVRWGLPLVVHDRFDPTAVNAAIEAGEISHLSLAGSMLGRLLDLRGGRPAPASLRAILLGGERTPPELVRDAALAGLPVVPTYGLTETASGVVALTPDEALERPDAAGRALPGACVRIRIDDRDADPGEIGEIEVRGPMVFAGYLDRPEDTAAAFDGDWFRTGDLGSIDAADILNVVDRRDDLIVSGGENVYPAEVEAILRGHPDLVDAGVIGRLDDRWGAVPVAAIVVRTGMDPTDDALAEHCRRSLAGYKVPVAFIRVAAIPRTSGGKLVRRDLRDLRDVRDAPDSIVTESGR